jgi:ComF family protein
LDLLYPPRCEACGGLRREAICAECWEGIVRVTPPWCEVCGAPFDPRAQAAPRCADCRGKRRPFSAARSAAHYEGPLAQAIRRFKYHSQMVLGKPLGALMVEALEGAAGRDLDPATVDVVCPVPLHESRLRDRGFNQSELLAESVAVAIERPLKHLLERTRPTLPQVDLPAASRAQNVRDAFAVRLEEVIASQRVLLIDDLFTTGATLLECARILRRAEAEEVRVLTLARAVPRWRLPASRARELSREVRSNTPAGV